jgi:hypothetical protein
MGLIIKSAVKVRCKNDILKGIMIISGIHLQRAINRYQYTSGKINGQPVRIRYFFVVKSLQMNWEIIDRD